MWDSGAWKKRRKLGRGGKEEQVRKPPKIFCKKYIFYHKCIHKIRKKNI